MATDVGHILFCDWTADENTTLLKVTGAKGDVHNNMGITDDQGMAADVTAESYDHIPIMLL